jgi:hypothetical protein
MFADQLSEPPQKQRPEFKICLKEAVREILKWRQSKEAKIFQESQAKPFRTIRLDPSAAVPAFAA